MIPREITFLFFRWQTYSAAILLALLITCLWLIWRAPSGQRRATADVLLAGLLGGVLLARVGHVWLWWAYFKDHQAEIIQLSAGGLDWHGAFFGALMASAAVAYWRKLDHGALLSRISFAVPLIGLATWVGCAAVGCAYGAEVAHLYDYPAGMAWIGPDIYGLEAARFNVQGLGALAALILLAIALMLQWRGWFVRTRFWLILLMWSLVVFSLGLLRGDHAEIAYSLRQDQWLDMATALFAFLMIWVALLRRSSA
ncbi:MAG: prolipoprotein diacylglyceryl transferase [Anaerolineae bacterium]|nr:prolipoprotein diacylglyceryl transferase [Anaerolineae bacterium]